MCFPFQYNSTTAVEILQFQQQFQLRQSTNSPILSNVTTALAQPSEENKRVIEILGYGVCLHILFIHIAIYVNISLHVQPLQG